MNTAPAPLASVIKPGVPLDLATTIARALERDPENRFSSAVSLGDALVSSTAVTTSMPIRVRPSPPGARFAAFVVAALLVAVIAGYSLHEWRASLPGERSTVVAVLPLENLSGDSSKAYLGAGVAETLTMALSKVPDLTVLSRSEVQEAVKRDSDAKKVAK